MDGRARPTVPSAASGGCRRAGRRPEADTCALTRCMLLLSRALLQVASPTPIFGASSTFGGTGFGGFSGAAAAAKPAGEAGEGDAAAAAGEGGEEGEEAGPEEECKAEFQPIVQLDEVEVSTGEEEEEALFDA